MTPADRRRRLQEILDRHDDMARAFQRTRVDIDATQEGLEQVGRTIRDMTHAISEAVDGMLAANRAVQALFNEETEDKERS